MKCPNCKVTLHKESGALELCLICGFTAPKNKREITELYAVLSLDPSTLMEGLVATEMPNGMIAQLVVSDPVLIPMMRDAAMGIARDTVIKTRLVKFSTKTILEEF